MIKKGKVSTADNINKKARITFPDMDNNVTYELPVAEHIGELIPGDTVIVVFWTSSMADGAVIAELR
ncbi:MAG TPA: hypothetical protein GXX35_11535 [Thermoanaerobacterales bacterium]|nr:hypothetical protein [Thermoanaerobacterales bacterium]